ncbi:MAG TPA: hypothetical protein VH592_14940 [Gemmataceae bacterium]
MSRLTTQYPERVYSMSEEKSQSGSRERPAIRRPGLVLAGLVALGVGAWMIYHFGPDFVRYMKMERM